MKIVLPVDAIAIGIQYKGTDAITVVRYYPEQNLIVPQMQLNANPSSKDYSTWQRVGPVLSQRNAQQFIADKSRTAARMWYLKKELRFMDIWSADDGLLQPGDIQLDSPVDAAMSPAEESADENQSV